MSSNLLTKNTKEEERHVEHNPEIIILPTPEDVDQLAARFIIDQVQTKPDSVLVLPTGNTPIGMYNIIAQAYRDGAVSFGNVNVFNLDEYWPLPSGHQDSYRAYMEKHFYNSTDIQKNNCHIPKSDAPDPQFEARLYDTMLKSHGPVNLAAVGIGPKLTCHVGFNEFGSSVDSRTRLVQLSDETIAANKPHFNKSEDMPPTALTMGIANILESERVILIAKGAHKAGGIQRALEGDIGPDAPASFLRYHPRAIFNMDNVAGQLLTNR